LHIVADGREIWPTREGETCRFALPAGAKAVVLASRRWRPADEVGAMESDRRPLGVVVTGFECNGIARDLSTLGRGWHRMEADGDSVWRRIDGNAELPAGAREIVVRVAQVALYLAEPAPAAPARLIADGVKIWPETLDDGALRFNLAQAARTVRLASPRRRPADSDWTGDCRHLGVAVTQIDIDGREQDFAALAGAPSRRVLRLA
jgi:hypothetical protein